MWFQNILFFFNVTIVHNYRIYVVNQDDYGIVRESRSSSSARAGRESSAAICRVYRTIHTYLLEHVECWYRHTAVIDPNYLPTFWQI